MPPDHGLFRNGLLVIRQECSEMGREVGKGRGVRYWERDRDGVDLWE